MHRVAFLLKRWVAGTLHHGLSPQLFDYYFDFYLDEFTFHCNRRNATQRGLLFYRLLQQALATDPHPLRDSMRASARAILIDGLTPETPDF